MFEFSVRKLRYINYLLSALILFVSLFLVKDLSVILLSKQQSTMVASEENTVRFPSPKIRDITSYSAILEKNPFGSPQKLRLISLTQDSENSQWPPSNLLLIGTVVGPKELSYAIFEDKTMPAALRQNVVAHGEDVLNYGKLSKIERTFVELSHGDATHKISLVPLKNDAMSPRADDTGVPRASLAEKIGDKEYLLNRRKVDQTLENPEQILTDARLLPNIQNGKQEGFRMLEVKPGGLYESLGLRNGDILLRVNDLEISNPEVAIQAMTALKAMNRVNLDIMRDGAKLSMSYEIK